MKNLNETPEKLHLLDIIYKLYNDITSQVEFYCKKGCHICCTENVCITTLEAEYILFYLGRKEAERIRNIMEKTYPHSGFRPGVTTNELAKLCMEGKDLPEENEHGNMPCPLLKENLCSIYSCRPFGCRSLFSLSKCTPGSEALIPSWLFTLNTVFLQLIEHIDVSGFYGNMLDIFPYLFYKNDITYIKNHRLRHTHKLPAFIIPPEDRPRINSILNKLFTLKINGTPLKNYL